MEAGRTQRLVGAMNSQIHADRLEMGVALPTPSLLARALCVNEDIDEFPEGIAHEKSPDTPGFFCRPIFDCHICLFHAAERIVKVIDLDRQIRNRSARAAHRCEADLNALGAPVGRDPAVIHKEIEPQHVLVKALAALGLGVVMFATIRLTFIFLAPLGGTLRLRQGCAGTTKSKANFLLFRKKSLTALRSAGMFSPCSQNGRKNPIRDGRVRP
jgi:hypothetical protein